MNNYNIIIISYNTIINFLIKVCSGTVNQNLNIVIDDGMHFHLGCSTTFMGQMWYFGSQTAKRQVRCFNRNNKAPRFRYFFFTFWGRIACKNRV